MEIANKATLNPFFFAGSSTLLGRAVAVRERAGILAAAALVALLLRRIAGARARAAAACRRGFWREAMRSALSYEEWAHAAKMLDAETRRGRARAISTTRSWCGASSPSCGGGGRRFVEGCGVSYALRFDPEFGNMCNPELHRGRLQVPKLIKEYIDEISTQLKMVCNSDSDELLLEEKLAFMHETRHAFGRTALLLSGGASLGNFHVGVLKTLIQHKLSLGSLRDRVRFFDQMGGVFTVLKRVMTYGAVHDIRQLQRLLRHLTSNLTFQEAYDMTGRILGVTVCSPRKHEPPRCLNYLTAPHVVIWSAVTASCAFPGIFEAQELMAKDRFGELVPFHAPISVPSNPHITPFLRLKELVRAYGGNFAAKLANLAEMEVKHRCNQILELGFPLGGIAKLFAQDWEGDITMVMPTTLSQYSKIIQNQSYSELQNAANQGRRSTWEKLSAIRANCAVELVLDECVALLNHTRRLKRSADRAAAAAAAAAQGCTRNKRFNAPRRIPSWNRIASENSSGSLEEEFLTDSSASVHQGMDRNLRPRPSVYETSDSESESIDLNSWTRSGGPLMRTDSAKKFISFIQNLEIASELKHSSPREDELNASAVNNSNSASAQMVSPSYASSRENTDGESCEARGSRALLASASTSFMVSEGDLLQPERTDGGILFSIVKKENLFVQGNGETDLRLGCMREADVESVKAECRDALSACDDDGDDDDDDDDDAAAASDCD
uniref:PNPLA domain-containing protein n=1 Tax=Ananas comosus var. bracteatus TaxID=296719 RepID=A0A6V7PFU5_ANACO|nr:unnamed protein product [Ananas comosus var. bracteatus]